MFLRLKNRSYVIPVESINNIKNIQKQIERKRERLIEKKQINENDFEPLKINISKISKNMVNEMDISDYRKVELLKEFHRNVLIQFEGDTPNIKEWSILGFIEPVLGQKDKYTLHSYSNQDLPEQYRNLENPTKCDHCETNRKRNQTFVIQNRDTSEVLQVGSACMKDFISTKEVGMLMTYANIFKEMEEDAMKISREHPSISLLNKEEFLATLFAFDKSAKELNFEKLNNDSERNFWSSKVFQYFNYLEDIETFRRQYKNEYLANSGMLLLDFFNKIEVTDNDLDLAAEVVDFYEDLDSENYSDYVFNLKELVGSDMDFLSIKECSSIINAIYIKDLIENKKPDLIDYLANHKQAVVIGDKIEMLPTSFDKEDLLAALTCVGEKDLSYTQFYNSSPLNPTDAEKAKLLIFPILKESYFKELYRKGYDEEQIENFKKKIDSYEITEKHYETAQAMIKYYKNEKLKDLSFNQKRTIEIINNDKNYFSLMDSKYIGFSYFLYKEIAEKQKKMELTKEKMDSPVIRNIGGTGDKIESVELKYLGAKAIDSEFGSFYLHRFKDINENVFTATSGYKMPFKTDEEDVVNKWVTVSGGIKGHKKYDIRKYSDKIQDPENPIYEYQTQLNRIKNITEFRNEPVTDGDIVLKGKVRLMELKLNSVFSEGDVNFYSFEDKNDKKYQYITRNTLNVEKNKVLRVGVSLSINEKDIMSIKKDNVIVVGNDFKDDFETKELTVKQFEKEIGKDNIEKVKVKSNLLSAS